MDAGHLLSLPYLRELTEEVRSNLRQLAEETPDRRAALEHEHDKLTDKLKGWAESLANRNLPTSVRRAIETEWASAEESLREIDLALAELNSKHRLAEQLVSPEVIRDRIERLPKVLADNDPTIGNLELSLHIDKIVCSASGQVVVRTCKLGLLPEAIGPLSTADEKRDEEGATGAADAVSLGGPRRRGRLKLHDVNDDHVDIRALADFAVDTNRFVGLDGKWFEECTFEVPKLLSWAEEHAPEVGKLRKEGRTVEQLAQHFGKSVPTIRQALKVAKSTDPELRAMPEKMPRARWHELHAQEVADVKAKEDLGTKDLVSRFGVSDTTIRKALAHAEKLKAGSAAP